MNLSLDLNSLFNALVLASVLGAWASLRGQAKEVQKTLHDLLVWKEGQQKDTEHLTSRVNGHSKQCNFKMEQLNVKVEELKHARKQN